MDVDDLKAHLLTAFEGVDDEEKVVKIALQACSTVVKGTVLRKLTAKWFGRTGGKESTEDSDPKFGDGIDKATGANKPSEILKLKYYEDTYTAYGGSLDAAGINSLLSGIGSWSYPTHTLWTPDTIDDLKHNADVVLQHHSFGNTPEVVLPLYLYSASQKGYPYVWTYFSHQGQWSRVRDPGSLEAAFQAGGAGKLEVQQAWVCPAEDTALPPCGVAMSPCTAVPEGYEVHASFSCESAAVSGHRFRLLRFSTPGRGEPTQAPLRDTVAWLPPPTDAEGVHFAAPLDSLPGSGVLEYIYSRGAEEDISWVEQKHGAELGWCVSYALGLVSEALIDRFFAEPNQQEYNSGLHADFKALMSVITAGAVDDRFIRLIAAASCRLSPTSPPDTSGSPGAEGGASSKAEVDEALGVFANFQACMQSIRAAGITPAAVRELIMHKIGGSNEPPPGLLAHALEIQLLTQKGRSYIVALSGARPCILFENQVVPLFRVNLTYDDQIFWQLNYTMRMQQWKVTPKLHVNTGDHKGKYIFKEDSKKFLLEGGTKEACPKAGGWEILGKALPGESIWFEAATWLLSDIMPLMYFIDRALDITAKSQPRAEVKTYRGLKNVSLPRDVYSEEKVVLWGAYSSTSGDRGVATSFAGEDTKVAVFSMVGTRPVCISRFSRYGREREFLYPANSQFQVTSSLSEDQQDLLGKKNLQIFSLLEVDEKRSIVQYLCTLVNYVIRCEKAALMPRHVKQIIKVMQAIEDDNYALALRECCDPRELVVHTDAGIDVAQLLQNLGGATTSGVIRSLAREAAGPEPEKLLRLVMAGGVSGLNIDDAFAWLHFFESTGRAFLECSLFTLQEELAGRTGIVAEEHAASLAFQSNLGALQLEGLDSVVVSGMKGAALHLNGVYTRGLSSDAPAGGGGAPGACFQQVAPTRLTSNPTIVFDSAVGLWRLSDLSMRNQHGVDPALEKYAPVNGTLLTWGKGLHWHQDPACPPHSGGLGWPVVKRFVPEPVEAAQVMGRGEFRAELYTGEPTGPDTSGGVGVFGSTGDDPLAVDLPDDFDLGSDKSAPPTPKAHKRRRRRRLYIAHELCQRFRRDMRYRQQGADIVQRAELLESSEWKSCFRAYLLSSKVTVRDFRRRWSAAMELNESALEEAGKVYKPEKFEAAAARRDARIEVFNAYFADPANAESIARKKFVCPPVVDFLVSGLWDDLFRQETAAGSERGLLTIGIGQAGCQVVESLWPVYRAETEATPEGLRSVLYAEKSNGVWAPRGLFFDSDPDPPLLAKQRLRGHHFEHTDFYYGNESCVTFGKAAAQSNMLNKACEAVRHQIERCDYTYGIHLHHSSGGGFGSGFTAALMERLRCDYPQIDFMNFCLLPSGQLSSPVEPYNALLSAFKIQDYTDLTVSYTNDAIYKALASPAMQVPNPTYHNVNRLVARVNAAVTAPIRFPQISTGLDMRCLTTNLVPYPILNQVVPSLGPLVSKYTDGFQNVSSSTMTHAVSTTSLASVDVTSGRLLGTCMLFRGNVSSGQANHAARKVRSSMNFCSWQPGGVKSCVSDAPPASLPDSDLRPSDTGLAMLSNTSAISTLSLQIAANARRLWTRRAFAHHFMADGGSLEESDLSEAAEHVSYMKSLYSEVTTDMEEDEEEYE